MTLFTIGYEGLDLDTFLSALIAERIDIVADVRELPLSRKKGFSKTALGHNLASAGIEYRHIGVLGCPKPVRDKYKSDRNWPAYTAGFRAYLSEQKDAVAALAEVAGKKRVCLLCFEADQNFCHRSLISEALERQYNFITRHLNPGTTIAARQNRVAA